MKTCPRCGFYNSDERDRCLKCKAILEHDWGVAQHKVRVRRLRFHRVPVALGNAWLAVKGLFRFPLPESCSYRRPWLAGFLGLLPGLGQLYNHQIRKAVFFFAGFLVTLWLAIVTINHLLSYVFIAVFVGWVLSSFNDALVTATKIDGQEWPRGYSLAMFSALFFYFGVFWSFSQYFLVLLLAGLILYSLYNYFWRGGEVSRGKVLATAIVCFGLLALACWLSGSFNPVLNRWIRWSHSIAAPALERGDRIYVDSFTYWFRKPRIGEVVLYNPDEFRIWQGKNLFVIDHYNAIERVVALPGDRFERNAEGFFRNGQPVPPGCEPLYPQGLPGAFAFDVPVGRYLILISYGGTETLGKLAGVARAPNPNEGATEDWGAACKVAPDQILGRCLFTWHPPSRRRWWLPRPNAQ